ncbi:hypothetical protein HM131_10275 [Halobacillus mangrovi]|uniref:DUF309 domain-containing protein n=1 Tax=Halobacillus mangrovi TaxID=402384 RepID=A0A1W5ZV86_9BACI|nr:hypothetical protein HM131_10275 [Halobacillus mangrovi]
MYPDLYIDYLAHFHGTRDYFECHEVLEEHWKNVDPKNRNSVWVFLIQLAVCMYHYRRGNRKGAEILINRCLKRYPTISESLEEIGLEKREVLLLVQEVRTRLINQQPYKSTILPICDNILLDDVRQKCKKWGVTYGKPSNLLDHYLINKHSLRNRP